MAQSCHYTSSDYAFGLELLWLLSQPRYTAQLRDHRSPNREISFMAGQLFCINLRRLAGNVIQLRAGVQEAYLRKSLHGHLVVKTEEEGKGPWRKKRESEREKVENRNIKPGLDGILFSSTTFSPPVSGSWKLGSRPLSRNLVNFSIFLCCTYSINFLRFA